jgi:hypothetical protein
VLEQEGAAGGLVHLQADREGPELAEGLGHLLVGAGPHDGAGAAEPAELGPRRLEPERLLALALSRKLAAAAEDGQQQKGLLAPADLGQRIEIGALVACRVGGR